MAARVAIVDYGMGNLYSVSNTFASLGIQTDIVSRGSKLLNYGKLILPGVGAFGDAMKELKKSSLIVPIKDFVSTGRPFLGICLGMQLLLDKSDESKGVAGLSVIPGVVKRFSGTLKCPHMGWNKIEKRGKASGIFKDLGKNIYAYFCHSYFAKPSDKSTVIGETEYGIKFASVIQYKNVYGMQFHPEKSQDTGLQLLRNFIELC